MPQNPTDWAQRSISLEPKNRNRGQLAGRPILSDRGVRVATAPKTGISSNVLPRNEFREGIWTLVEAESAVSYRRPRLFGGDSR